MNWDVAVQQTLNKAWTCTPLDWWTAIVTATQVWAVPFLLALGVVIWRGGTKSRSALLLAGVVLFVGDVAVVHSFKVLTNRPRPRDILPQVRSVHLADVQPRILALGEPLVVSWSTPATSSKRWRSFPSGHTWDAFAAATLLAFWRKRTALIAFPVAIMVAFARVYCGAHWPTDVLASAVMAPVVTWGLAVAWTRLHATRGQERSPATTIAVAAER